MNKLKTIFLLLAFILAMNMSGVQNIKAENYPYKSDYLWLTVPDHLSDRRECQGGGEFLQVWHSP